MKRLGTAAACLLLGGCAAMPPSPAGEGIREADIVSAVQCEVRRAKYSAPGLAELLNAYDFALELDLKLVTDTGAGAAAVLVLPQAPETVSLGGGLTFAGRATRQSVLSIKIDPRTLKRQDCVVAANGMFSNPEVLGVDDWLRATFGGLKEIGATIGSGTYEVEFMLTRGINGSLGVVAYRVTGAGATLSASRVSTHRLKVAAAVRPKDAPLRVEIVNFGKDPTATKLGTREAPSMVRRSRSGGGSDDPASPQIPDQLNELLSRDRPLIIQTR
jgi:hypothetical protein